jgi:hypothetical protein
MGMDLGAKAAKRGVHAARKSLSRVLGDGHARARDIVDASGRRADDSLDVVERAVIGVLDARGQLHEVQARLLPRRRASPLGTVIAGLGAGVLLSLLLMPKPAAKPAR